MDCFSIAPPYPGVHVFERHEPALGDALEYGGMRAVSSTRAVSVENVFDSCSRGDDEDCSIEDFERENVAILSGPFGESMDLGIGSLGASVKLT